jgi:HK97 gp10 family phage protein
VDEEIFGGGDRMSADFNNWDEIADKWDRAISRTIRKAAFDIQAQAQANAPVDTGFLKASIYTVTWKSSNYGKGKASKTGGRFNPSAVHELLPEIEKPFDDQTAYVAVGASYGEYVELGTVHQRPQPYLFPAVDAIRPSFEAALGKIEEKLGQDVGGSIEDESI